MLQSLELENFKAFGERARIPFAPITLIFGENSAGKSTILQALNLLKQTRESRESDAVLLPRVENGIVDLGSFQEMIFDHELKRTLSIRVETVMDRKGMVRLPYKDNNKDNKVAIEFSFKRPSVNQVIRLEQIKIYYGKSSKCIAEFQPLSKTEESEEFSFRMNFFSYSRGIPISELTEVKCVWLTEESEYWEPEFKWCKENRKEILDSLESRLKGLTHLDMELQEDNNRPKEERDFLEDYIKLFRSDSFDLRTYISKRHEDEINTVLGVHGFLPMVGRPRSPFARRTYNRFDVAQLGVAAGRALEQALESFFPMGPFRRLPERWYVFRGTTPQDVGYRADLLPDLLFHRRRRKLIKDTNEWLKRLDIGYELEIKSVGANSGDLFEIRLIDTRRKERVNVALPDVGFGISQLLPFIVQSLVSGKRIISIEQPEVHVHPRLQADLGDLLAEVIIKEPRLKQFIIETHSEHLILRLQRLVRNKQIKPEDISVIYVSRGPDGAKAERLRLDEEGDFIDEWPNGFFAERLREL